jgi:hypothetical protein
MSLPADLRPLPTMPYSERPIELPLDVEECRTAIWKCRGNVSSAADLLKIPSSRLRTFISKSPYLSAEQKEANERLVDIAEDVVYDALTDNDDPSRRDTMARFVLTGLGKNRGHGSGGGGVSINLPKGPIQISWGDGSDIVKTIDGEVNK